ncbi:MAG: ROK family protein [Chthoniobacterales bacterium]
MKNVKLSILVIDVGGSRVKIKATGRKEERKFLSGPTMTPQMMVDGVKQLAKGWHYDVVSIGCPMPVSKDGKLLKEPVNLGKGWIDFDYESAFGCPVHIINDAAMQALGDYRGGRMLFLGLGTGLGSTLIEDGVILPMELAHLPYKRKTFEDYVGIRGFKKYGKKKWQKEVNHVVQILQAALQPEKVVLGGGNAQNLTVIPVGCVIAANSNAFIGGFRLWEHFPGQLRAIPRSVKKQKTSKNLTPKKPTVKNILPKKK